MVYIPSQLSEIAEIFSGYAFSSHDLVKYGIPVIKIANIQNKRVLKECTDYLPNELLSSKLERYFLQDRDCLVAMTGAGSVGKFGKMWGSSGRYLVNQRVGIIRPDEAKCNPIYLYYVLCHDQYEKTLYSLGLGAGQPNVSAKEIGSLNIPYPPLPTQHKIAAILTAYDDLIENNTRRIKILEETAQLIYCEWFVNFRFPDHENANMVNSSLGSIPDGWKTVRTEQIVKRIPAGRLYEQKTVSPSGIVPVLDQGRSGIIGYHNDSPSVIASEETPVIVFANHTCYQRLIQYPFSAIQNVLPFVPNPDRYRNIYWLHWATKDLVEFNDYKGHWPEFMSKTLLLPSEELCDYFGDTVKPISKLIYNFERSNIILRETRDLLLPKLISGELDVSGLDIEIPEEPA